MIVRFSRPGASFGGLAKYLTHDPKAPTTDRVAWTHTLNLANDHIPSAVDEMYRTFSNAELLREDAGIKRGGRQLEKPVKHVSLNWHPDDEPTKEHMIGTAESFLRHMGWSEYQAVLVAHSDKDYEHLHIELNAVHPETGLKLDDGFEKRRAQTWALEYERAQDCVRCEQRLRPIEEREDAPSRSAWQGMKEAEQQHIAAERLLVAELRPELWTEKDLGPSLKVQQREQREAFFADGREAYQEARNRAFREVRDEFRGEWREFFAAQRDGQDMDQLAELKADLVSRQHEALVGRRDDALQQLRENRDDQYAGLLATQRAERADLRAHLAMGGTVAEYLEKFAERAAQSEARNDNDISLRADDVSYQPSQPASHFRSAGIEVCSPCGERAAREPSDEAVRGETAAESPRVRDPVDLGASLAAVAVDQIATIGEHFFDALLDDASRSPAKPAEPRAEPAEPPQAPFTAAADAARRRAEWEDENERRNEWWDDRRARARD